MRECYWPWSTSFIIFAVNETNYTSECEIPILKIKGTVNNKYTGILCVTDKKCNQSYSMIKRLFYSFI